MASEGNRLDVIIFGATGFTGKIAVYEVVKLAKEKSITWGIAGRNKNKLENVLKEVEKKTGNFVDHLMCNCCKTTFPCIC